MSKLSLIFNKLVDRVSRDEVFLTKHMMSAAKGDPSFTLKMLHLYQKVMKVDASKRQHYQLGIFRSDYMKDNHHNGKWGQIELNTISVCFGGLSDKVFNLHRFLLSRHLGVTVPEMNATSTTTSSSSMSATGNESKLAESEVVVFPKMSSGTGVARALAVAAKLVHPDQLSLLLCVCVFVCVSIALMLAWSGI